MPESDEDMQNNYGSAWGSVRKYKDRSGQAGYKATSKSGSVKLFANKELAHRHADSEEDRY